MILAKAKTLAYLLCLLGIFQSTIANYLSGNDELPGEKIQTGVYYKIDQGATWSILLDQRMSNLHYSGPGGILNFGRYAKRSSSISELSFARLQFNYSKPAHKNTVVENPVAGIRYMYLRKLSSPENYQLYTGGQVNILGNFRLAPRLGNSYLFADMIGELRPQAEMHFSERFLWRNWNIELSAAASLLGYTVRIPEYGVSFELDEDGGVKTQGFEKQFLMPHNYAHITTGLFIRESFWGDSNPNWFRIGYTWDFYTMSGKHNLNTNSVFHHLLLELYFKTR